MRCVFYLSMDVEEVACVCALLISLRKKKPRKRCWVHPIISARLLKGQFHCLYEDLRCNPQKFFGYYRMSKESFDDLLRLVGPSITFQDTSFRKSVPPEERLSVTLRYLATGCSMVSLHYEYLLGTETIREIIKDVTEKLWTHLVPVCMPEMDEDSWLRTANDFYQKTQFPNCIGAVDGKHIRICQPNNTGSLFFNYKSFFSIVLLGVVDANYCFLSVDIGSFGSCSDSYAFKKSNFGQRLERGQLKLPANDKLPGDVDGPEMPFVLVGDEAFALSEHVLRPYARKNLTQAKRIFNYRLTRARRMVECAFRILANKWRIFHGPINVNPDFCNNIIKACCVLHNYVRRRDGVSFDDVLFECPMQGIDHCRVRSPASAVSKREYFTQYFTSPEGSVSWQNDKI